MEIRQQKSNKQNIITCFRVLFFYILSVVILITVSALTKELPGLYADTGTVFFSSLLTFVLVVLFTKWEKLKLNAVGIVPGRFTLKRFSTGFLIGITMAVLQALIAVCLSRKHLTLSLNPGIGGGIIAVNLLLYFFVAVREELAFRSYPLRALNYSFRSVAALSIIIIIFILEHVIAGMDWKMAVIGSGLGGLLFGLAALRTQGLALPIGLHCAWNFGQWSMGFKNDKGIYKATVEKGYELQTENIGLLAFIFVMLLGIFFVIRFIRQPRVQIPADTL